MPCRRLDGQNLRWMETELRPLLPRAMSACAAGCGPSALAALQVQIHTHRRPDFQLPNVNSIHFSHSHRSPPGQRRESIQECVGRGGV